MANHESLSLFELVTVEFQSLGLTIRRLPGEYLVNFRDGSQKTARFADDLDQALEIGRELAATRAAAPTSTTKPPRRKWGRKKMTPKARRRRFIRGHNRRVRARAMRKNPSR